MNPAPELQRPRELGNLLGEALHLYRGHFFTLLALAAAIVVPAHLIVSGVGLEQITAPFDRTPPAVEQIVPAIVELLIVTPLVNAVCIHALHDVAAGQRPGTRSSLVSGLELFAPLLAASLLLTAGIALGLLLLIVPGVYLAVRWYVVPQVVVIEGARDVGALARSYALVEGRWWRTFVVLLLSFVAALVPALVLAAPFTAIADSTDRALFGLIGSIVAEAIAAPFAALVATLYYYDMRARS